MQTSTPKLVVVLADSQSADFRWFVAGEAIGDVAYLMVPEARWNRENEARIAGLAKIEALYGIRVPIAVLIHKSSSDLTRASMDFASRLAEAGAADNMVLLVRDPNDPVIESWAAQSREHRKVIHNLSDGARVVRELIAKQRSAQILPRLDDGFGDGCPTRVTA